MSRSPPKITPTLKAFAPLRDFTRIVFIRFASFNLREKCGMY